MTSSQNFDLVSHNFKFLCKFRHHHFYFFYMIYQIVVEMVFQIFLNIFNEKLRFFSGITCPDESLTTRPGTCIKQINCRLLPALKQRRIVWRTNIQVRRKKLGQACSDPTAASHLTAAELINCTITTALTHYWPLEGQNSFTISTLETHWDGHLRRRRTYIVRSPWQLKKKTILAVS